MVENETPDPRNNQGPAVIDGPPVAAAELPLASAGESRGPESLINRGDLKRIKDAPTATDSVIATMDWLQANQSISADVRGIVVLALEANRSKLEPALVANTNN